MQTHATHVDSSCLLPPDASVKSVIAVTRDGVGMSIPRAPYPLSVQPRRWCTYANGNTRFVGWSVGNERCRTSVSDIGVGREKGGRLGGKDCLWKNGKCLMNEMRRWTHSRQAVPFAPTSCFPRILGRTGNHACCSKDFGVYADRDMRG